MATASRQTMTEWDAVGDCVEADESCVDAVGCSGEGEGRAAGGVGHMEKAKGGGVTARVRGARAARRLSGGEDLCIPGRASHDSSDG